MEKEQLSQRSQEACDTSLARRSAAAGPGGRADGGGHHRPVHTAAASRRQTIAAQVSHVHRRTMLIPADGSSEVRNTQNSQRHRFALNCIMTRFFNKTLGQMQDVLVLTG